MARVLYMGLPFPAEPQKTAPSSSSSSSPSKPLKLPHRTCSTNISIPSTAKGGGNRLLKTQKLNSEVSPHRAVSAVRLMRIELGGAFADLLNEKGKGSGENEMGYVQRTLGFRTRELNHHDLRLVTDIVGGTIRWRRYLDHLISSLCHDKDISSMEPLLLQILRIGFYEIVKLDMPPYAVVDENVKLAKFALRPGAGNMVNGILRKLVVLKEKESLPLPKVEGDDRAQARALATLYSHPVWMVRRWTKYLGQEEAIKLMIWNNSEPSFSLRLVNISSIFLANRARGFSRDDLVTQLNALKVPHKLSPHLDEFVRIKTGLQIIIQAGLLKKGLCSVQDESAGLVVSVVDPQPGETIIDCCAAPGGKTLYMASHLSGQGKVFAIDVNSGRLRILKETAKLHQVDGVITAIHADLRTLPDSGQLKSNKVLLDAPCSGLGVLSKRADLRWNKNLEDMEQLKELQDELLDAASKLVKPGGVLVYSTCSIDPEENDDRVVAFLARHSDFHIDPVDRYVPPDFETSSGFFFSNPVKHSLDGSFAARLVRDL
ncbi:putative ribosomal RNA small subunit methyltransferase B [Glycine max]|nr:putative ribosomal RNA small subunit methyltransferase B [Glycine max]